MISTFLTEAVPSQIQECQELVIGYFSKGLGMAERNYCSTRKEVGEQQSTIFRSYIAEELLVCCLEASLLEITRSSNNSMAREISVGRF